MAAASTDGAAAPHQPTGGLMIGSMRSVELKIPPPVIAALVAACMWEISKVGPLLELPTSIRLFFAPALLLVGIGLSIAGVISFRRAKTTINPTKPELTSSLVSSGIYRFTRNPMYVGLLFGLIAFAIF